MSVAAASLGGVLGGEERAMCSGWPKQVGRVLRETLESPRKVLGLIVIILVSAWAFHWVAPQIVQVMESVTKATTVLQHVDDSRPVRS
jgi:hypothetical protein